MQGLGKIQKIQDREMNAGDTSTHLKPVNLIGIPP